MNALLKNKLPEVIDVLKKNRVKKAYAFGSVTHGKFNPESDVDILIAFEDGLDPIEYGDNYFKILYSLQDILSRSVDLVTERSLKNKYFIEELDRTKIPLYE